MRLLNTLGSMSKSSKVLWVAWVLLLIAWIVNFGTKNDYQESTERQTFVDTIPFYKPVPKDSFVIRYVTAKLPKTESKLPNDVKESHESGEILQKTHKIGKILFDSVNLGNDSFAHEIDFGNKPDSVDVDVPITQKVYSDDSTYTAYVSGYQVQLDSLIFQRKREVITITKWEPPKRWSIGVQAGYGMSRNGMQPYIGIGVSYNLFSF